MDEKLTAGSDPRSTTASRTTGIDRRVFMTRMVALAGSVAAAEALIGADRRLPRRGGHRPGRRPSPDHPDA